MRAFGVVFLVILGCSGARPAADPGLPIGGLPEPAGGQPEPARSWRAPEDGPAPRRFETVRLSRPTERDPLAGGPRSLGHRVDLDLSRAPVSEAFRLLADAARVNVVLGDDVAGEVTLRLRRVTVREAIRAVTATRALETEWRGNILWIRTGDR